MEPKLQSCLTKFLYDTRVDGAGDGEGSQAAASDSLLLPMEQKAISVDDLIGTQAPVATDSAASCNTPLATPAASSKTDCVSLNAISTQAPDRMEFPPLPNLSENAVLPNVEILEPHVGSTLHVARVVTASDGQTRPSVRSSRPIRLVSVI
jgi:hypothetical protein